LGHADTLLGGFGSKGLLTWRRHTPRTGGRHGTGRGYGDLCRLGPAGRTRHGSRGNLRRRDGLWLCGSSRLRRRGSGWRRRGGGRPGNRRRCSRGSRGRPGGGRRRYGRCLARGHCFPLSGRSLGGCSGLCRHSHICGDPRRGGLGFSPGRGGNRGLLGAGGGGPFRYGHNLALVRRRCRAGRFGCRHRLLSVRKGGRSACRLALNPLASLLGSLFFRLDRAFLFLGSPGPNLTGSRFAPISLALGGNGLVSPGHGSTEEAVREKGQGKEETNATPAGPEAAGTAMGANPFPPGSTGTVLERGGYIQQPSAPVRPMKGTGPRVCLDLDLFCIHQDACFSIRD